MQAHVGRIGGKKRKAAPSSSEAAPSSSADALGSSANEDAGEGPSGDRLARPLGQKKVKSDDQKAAFLEQMSISVSRRQKEALEVQKQLLAEMKASNEMTMLTADPDSIKDPIVRQVHRLRLKKLLARLQQEETDDNENHEE
jgi:hypothetical protein